MLRMALGALAALVLLAALVRARYGGGELFPDRSAEPQLAATALETVADLEWPPGNIAVSDKGRVFLTLHPEARPPFQVAVLEDGEVVPFPAALSEGLEFQSVLAVRIDRQGRLWCLDNAHHGLGEPRLLAFDLASGALVHRFDFPRDLAGRGSHLNDFQVAADGERIYIADASIFALRPALIVYDVVGRRARRLLEGHVSVTAELYAPVVQGRRMSILGLFTVRPGVDSIALDRQGQWLYFAPVTASKMYRIRRAELDDETLSAEDLASRVEAFADKTMSDGITTDLEGNLYLSDLEHSAIIRLDPQGQLRTLLRDQRLRWPDGFSFGPDGWLYVTCSALHQVIGRTRGQIRAHAPYQVFRFRPGVEGVAGH